MLDFLKFPKSESVELIFDIAAYEASKTKYEFISMFGEFLHQTHAEKKQVLLIIDESHMTLPQVRGMYGGDQSRKQNLVDYGFRLPSAMDNRPLKFEEWEARSGQTIFVNGGFIG